MIRWLLGGGSGFSNRKKHTPLPRCASLSDIPCYSETIASLGHTPAQVCQDEEGMQTMRTLGESIAYSIRNKDAGLRERVKQPEYERPVMTNFIRKE